MSFIRPSYSKYMCQEKKPAKMRRRLVDCRLMAFAVGMDLTWNSGGASGTLSNAFHSGSRGSMASWRALWLLLFAVVRDGGS